MSFFSRIAARAASTGPVLQPKDGGVRRAAAHEEEEPHAAMRMPIRRMDAKPPEEDQHVARASAKPAVSRATSPEEAMQARRSADHETEEPKAHRAAAPEDDKHEVHRAATPEEEPKARPSRRAPAANVHDPEQEDAVHRAAAEPHDDAMRRAQAPGPNELTPENSPTPNEPPQTGVKPLVMAIRRDASPAPSPAVPAANSVAVGNDAPTAWTPAIEPEAPAVQAPFVGAYEPPIPPSFAPQSLRFGERADVVIDRIDVLVQEPAVRASAGLERSATRSLRARYLRSL